MADTMSFSCSVRLQYYTQHYTWYRHGKSQAANQPFAPAASGSEVPRPNDESLYEQLASELEDMSSIGTDHLSAMA